ncbi:MAG: 50S ribosomal protein L11 methyltransferase [Chitinophagaceae bacterium]
MNHTQIIISTSDTHLQDILIAALSEIGYDGFEQDENCLKAYIEETHFEINELNEIINVHQVAFTKNIIEQQNWNEVWESNFEPVTVDDFVGIRAHFHLPITGVQHEIVITPKMSFGTGHHATTYSVMQLMKEIDFANKTVFDFGTGTGILAILAEKLGATEVLAVDYDDWCIENSIENIAQNNCTQIEIKKADTAITNKAYDIILANINKNIIQDNFNLLHLACDLNSFIVLSGLLIEDETDILNLAQQKRWQHIKTIIKGAWIAVLFKVNT